MRLIVKRAEPGTVRDTRLAGTTDLSAAKTARVAFNQLDKGAVRQQLAAEQGYLCAFCMRSIEPTARLGREVTMKIAHRTPIDANASLALSWPNMLGACDGGERSSGLSRTCDTAQGSTPLAVDPTSPASIARLSYEARTERTGLFITSDDPVLRAEVDSRVRADGVAIDGVLALNSGDLPELRLRAWDAFRERYRRLHPNGPWGKAAYRAYLPKFVAQSLPRLPEMIGMIEAKVR